VSLVWFERRQSSLGPGGSDIMQVDSDDGSPGSAYALECASDTPSLHIASSSGSVRSLAASRNSATSMATSVSSRSSVALAILDHDSDAARSSPDSLNGACAIPGSLAGGLTPPGAEHLASCFSWAAASLLTLARSIGQESIRESLLGSAMVVSTHFSGVGTAELAITCLAAFAPNALGFPLRLTPSFACESNRVCQRLLAARSPSSACLFIDILDISMNAKQIFTASSAVVDFHTVRAAIMQGPVTRNRPCVRHGPGVCAQPHTDGDIGGSPCTLWSRAGLLRRESDRSICLLLTWCRWLIDAKPTWAIHENVDTFDRNLLRGLIGCSYDVVFLDTAPADAGFPFVTRKRVYCICLLRGRVREAYSIHSAYSDIRAHFSEHRPTVVLQACLLASPEELLAEENKIRKLRGLPPLSTLATQRVDWTYLLTSKQSQRLRVYADKWPDADAYNLGHNPLFAPSVARKGRLPTLTRNSSRWWVPAHTRWMTAKELTAASGYPVTEELAQAAGVPIDVCADQYGFRELGNCMHVAVVGCVIASSLACLKVL
jgi:site-specific DNA-cytosine methylase